MKRHIPFYVLAGTILLVGAVAFGAPASILWILVFVVACPLMMIFMMGSMRGGGDAGGHRDDDRNGVDLTKGHDPHS